MLLNCAGKNKNIEQILTVLTPLFFNHPLLFEMG